MRRPSQRNWLVLSVIGLMLLLVPVLFLVITLEALILLGEIEFEDLSALELVELYLIDLAVLVLFAYAVYRVTLYAVENQLPTTLDKIETTDEPVDDETE